MSSEALEALAAVRRSFLCVALDPSPEVLPPQIEAAAQKGDLTGVEAFLRKIIQETEPYAIAYKLNTAFYERFGPEGWHLLARVKAAIPQGLLTIADAKRGDIAYTNAAYAEAFFERYGFDAVTVQPYLGWGALAPFLRYEGKWVFVLLRTTEGAPWQGQVWPQIVAECPSSASATIGWVWGAHFSGEVAQLRALRPREWLLMPGLGAQGGEVQADLSLAPFLAVVGRSLLQAEIPSQAARAWASRTWAWAGRIAG